MDSGTSPAIDPDQYAPELPMNVDDESLPHDSPLEERPMTQLTQLSIQILLIRTMPIRLKIPSFINGTESGGSAETALASSAELTHSISSCKALLKSYVMGSRPPTTFQTRLFDILVHRLLLAIYKVIGRLQDVEHEHPRNWFVSAFLPCIYGCRRILPAKCTELRHFPKCLPRIRIISAHDLLSHSSYNPIFMSDN
jgi:hypothetical protein